MSIQPILQVKNERQKTWSTTSFYGEGKNSEAGVGTLFGEFDAQQKNLEETLEQLMTETKIKGQQLRKVTGSSNGELQELKETIITTQNQVLNTIKKLQKEDQTKPWSRQLQKTIHESIRAPLSTFSSSQKLQKNTTVSINQKIQTIFHDFTQERKERESCWERVIDELGQSMLTMEEIIASDHDNAILAIQSIQMGVEELEEQLEKKLQVPPPLIQLQRKSKEQDNSRITMLIQNVMNKLLI